MNTKICARYNVAAISGEIGASENSIWLWMREGKTPKNPKVARAYKAALRSREFRKKTQPKLKSGKV